MTTTTLRQALRSLRRNPAFALAAIATLGAGIGLTTALFSVVYSVLLAPLNYPNSERIAALETTWTDRAKSTPRLTGADYHDLRRSAKSLQATSRLVGGQMGVQLGDHAEFTGVTFVEPAFFEIFSTPPLAGRAPGPHQAAVSSSFARRNFSTIQAALGRTLNIEKQAYEITAVLADSFAFPNRKNHVWAWFPPHYERPSRTAFNYRTVALLRAGVDPAAATEELRTLAVNLEKQFPAENKNKRFRAISLHQSLTGSIGTMLWVLMGAVSLVLLISCANVANLLLARATSRAREFSLRMALGAGPRRLASLLWAEGLILAAASAALGWALAWLGTGALLRLAPENLPRLDEVAVDFRAFAFACLAAALSSILFSLAPAWLALRADLTDTLKQGGRGSLGSGSQRLRASLVVAEIALAFLLALGAGVLGRGFASLLDAELGYRPDGVLVMYAHLPASSEADAIAAGSTFAQLTERLRSLPGVQNAAVVMGLPGGLYGSNGSYAVQGKHAFVPGEKMPEAGFRLSGPGYFNTMGIPLLRGRDFDASDLFSSEPVAIVSASLARQSFPGQDPLGQRIQCGLDRVGVWMRVVGVVGDVRSDSPAIAAAPELYMPATQHPFMANELQVAVRTASDPAALTSAVREATRQLDPSIATSFTTLRATLDSTISAPRFRTWLATLFAALALAFAVAGIHGVMSYAVSRRRAEFGLRLALGAGTPDIARLIVASALRWAAAGTLLGALLSLASMRALRSLLDGVESPAAPAVLWALAAVALATLASVAGPVLSASRVDPIAALRDE